MNQNFPLLDIWNPDYLWGLATSILHLCCQSPTCPHTPFLYLCWFSSTVAVTPPWCLTRLPCCHEVIHFKKQYNKISNNESFSSLYQSPRKRSGRARNRKTQQPSRRNNGSLDHAMRPLDFPLSPLSFMHSPNNVRQHTDFASENAKVSVRQWLVLRTWDYCHLVCNHLIQDVSS